MVSGALHVLVAAILVLLALLVLLKPGNLPRLPTPQPPGSLSVTCDTLILKGMTSDGRYLYECTGQLTSSPPPL